MSWPAAKRRGQNSAERRLMEKRAAQLMARVPQIPNELHRAFAQDLPLSPELVEAGDDAIRAACQAIREFHLQPKPKREVDDDDALEA